MFSSALKSRKERMSNHTRMPPSLSDKAWDFGGWDNRKSFLPPWDHRGFWYTDMTNGQGGDTLVIIWRECTTDSGLIGICGRIYRCTNFATALTEWQKQKGDVGPSDEGKYAGLFIFLGTRRVSPPTVWGKPFPYPLPDDRWLP